MSLKIAGADGETNLRRVLSALEWIRPNPDAPGYNIRVVNLSLGVTSNDYRSDALAWAVEQLWNEGIVAGRRRQPGRLRAHAGHAGRRSFVIAAGASDTRNTVSAWDDRVADFSSRSRFRAPGRRRPGHAHGVPAGAGFDARQRVLGRTCGSKFFRGSGTSQAAAVTSGLAARLIDARPWLNPDQVKALLVEGAVDLPDPRSADGAGRIDLRRSLALPTPAAWDVKQRWEPAVLNLEKLRRELDDDDEALGPGAQWNGRRWSGRRWSGRRWSGAKWIVDSDD